MDPAGRFVAGGLSGLGVATAGATKQSVPIPTGAAVTAVLDAAGITRSGGRLTVSFPVSFTIPEGADTTSLPNVQMDFNITDTLDFIVIDGPAIGVVPLPPELTFSIGP